MTSTAVVEQVVEERSTVQQTSAPPKNIPNDLRDAYTLGGKVSVTYDYHDSTYPADQPRIYHKETVDDYITLVKNNENFYYGKTDSCLYRALQQYPISGKRVAVMGSTDPWYESVSLAYGGLPITIEYNTIITDDPRLSVLTVQEYDKHPQQFEHGFSISSFEHDGLGRYGDPLNPKADIEAMTLMKTVVRPNGLLFLAVPVGRDTVVWNAHRIYGSRRLPLLLTGWKIVDFFGVRPGNFQPVIVLQNSDAPVTVRDRLIRTHLLGWVRLIELVQRLMHLVTQLLEPLLGRKILGKIKTAIHNQL